MAIHCNPRYPFNSFSDACFNAAFTSSLLHLFQVQQLSQQVIRLVLVLELPFHLIFLLIQELLLLLLQLHQLYVGIIDSAAARARR